jgi:hypothetical protein
MLRALPRCNEIFLRGLVHYLAVEKRHLAAHILDGFRGRAVQVRVPDREVGGLADFDSAGAVPETSRPLAVREGGAAFV